ncbi:5,6-dimethylbenzimidazole synthase, partial [Streptomyces beijiangensis]|nr:5,6-dimethylbenzimidazole synthase [Streptomyces beijiangensis]
MTDTGQIPGEGQPENAGMVEQPGIPAPGAYTFLDPSENTPEDDDLLLMPASAGAWSDPQPAAGAAQVPASEYGAHEAGGRDSGSVDLSDVRMQFDAPAPAQATTSAPTPPPARRPLHMGPPVPDASAGVVRSLADRGPTATPANPMPMRNSGPPTTGPEYFDIPAEDAPGLPGPQLGEIPPQAPTSWTPEPQMPVPAHLQAHTPPPVQAQEPQHFAVATAVPADPAVSAAPAETVVPEPVMAGVPMAAAPMHQAQTPAEPVPAPAAPAVLEVPVVPEVPVAPAQFVPVAQVQPQT